MRIARGMAWALVGALFAFAPAWAQDTQQAPPPPPAAAPASGPQTSRRVMVYRSGPGGARGMVFQRQGMMGPGRGMVATGGRMGPGGNMFFERFRRMGGARGMGFGARFGNGAGAGFGRGAMVDRLLNNANLRKQLGITDAQAAKIRQQTTDFQVAQIHSRADLQVDRLQLRNLLAAPTPDRTAIDQKLDQIGAAQIAERKQEIGYFLDMRDALTPEQRQKLEQMRQAPMRRGGRGQAGAPATPAPAPAGQPNQ